MLERSHYYLYLKLQNAEHTPSKQHMQTLAHQAQFLPMHQSMNHGSHPTQFMHNPQCVPPPQMPEIVHNQHPDLQSFEHVMVKFVLTWLIPVSLLALKLTVVVTCHILIYMFECVLLLHLKSPLSLSLSLFIFISIFPSSNDCSQLVLQNFATNVELSMSRAPQSSARDVAREG